MTLVAWLVVLVTVIVVGVIMGVVPVVMMTMRGDDDSLNLPMMFSGCSLAAKV